MWKLRKAFATSIAEINKFASYFSGLAASPLCSYVLNVLLRAASAACAAGDSPERGWTKNLDLAVVRAHLGVVATMWLPKLEESDGCR
jgi:hypothetical protein